MSYFLVMLQFQCEEMNFTWILNLHIKQITLSSVKQSLSGCIKELLNVYTAYNIPLLYKINSCDPKR